MYSDSVLLFRSTIRNESYRTLAEIELPSVQSAFLWGPRKTGKSTFLKKKSPQSIIFDFLKTDLLLEFSKRPFFLREQLLAKKDESLEYPVILDEEQKIPQPLDEVHRLIENKKLRFIICGSSARKLKHGKVNLLGGRAWRFEMHPLVFPELENPDLLRALNHGLIPSHYLAGDYRNPFSFVQAHSGGGRGWSGKQ